MLTQVINSVKPVFDKKEVLFAFYDHMSTGHFRVCKTYNKLSDWYRWPGMYKNIKEYVRQCSVCAQNKGRQNTAASAINPLPICKDFLVSGCRPDAQVSWVLPREYVESS